MASSPNQHADSNAYGVHENGDPVGVDQSFWMQTLDIVRWAKILAARNVAISARSTPETRREFERILQRFIATPHGDPEEEWQAFCRHREEQRSILEQFLKTPDGKQVFDGFIDHMAPLYGDAIRSVKMPLEPFERQFGEYLETFSETVDEIAAGERMQLYDVLQQMRSEEHLQIDEEKGDKFLIGKVLAPPNTEIRTVVPSSVLIDIEGRRGETGLRVRKQLAK